MVRAELSEEYGRALLLQIRRAAGIHVPELRSVSTIARAEASLPPRGLPGNGHGGNDPARARLYELSDQLPDLRIAWYSWWISNSVLEVAQKYQLKPTHANWLEAFPFTRVADLPQGSKIPPRVPGLMGAKESRQVYGDGTFGGPYEAAPVVMDEIFDAALKDILQLLRFE